jgi:hypothetical protein
MNLIMIWIIKYIGSKELVDVKQNIGKSNKEIGKSEIW